MRTARIAGTGYHLPESIVTNEDLYVMVKERHAKWISDPKYDTLEKFLEWSYRMSGVKSRHYAAENETPENLAYIACKRALDDANISAGEIRRIIFNTLTPGQQVYSAAARLQESLGMKECSAQTINQACAGFVWGLENAWQNIVSRNEPTLVVSADTLSKIKNLLYVNHCIIFSDGASAAVVVPSEDRGIVGKPCTGTNPSGDIKVDSKCEELILNGAAVRREAVTSMSSMVMEALKTTTHTLEDVKYILPHQANGRFLKPMATELNYPEERIINDMEDFGNNSGATVGIILDRLRKKRIVRDGIPLELREGDIIVMTATGGGYHSASLVYRE